MDIEMLQERARIIRQIRSFFDGKAYLELDTPLLAPDIIPESCLEVFETSRILPSGSSRPYWLIPSPEIWMKKIIARHRVSVYQICKCFRNGESSGFLHSPEFTMLEYYTMNADYMDSLALTEELVQFLCIGSTAPCDFRAPFERITAAEAFARYADFDLFAAAETTGGLETEARRLGLDPPDGMGTAELYDLIFIHAVEPRLTHNRPVALLNYPAFVPTLARQAEDGKTVERWELYHNGIELANCYSEETDAQRVRDFFESESKAKERQALVPHRVDHEYWKLFEGRRGKGKGKREKGKGKRGKGKGKREKGKGKRGKESGLRVQRAEGGEQGAGSREQGKGDGFPVCSGVALGVDRLIMALCGRSSIDGVLPFPME